MSGLFRLTDHCCRYCMGPVLAADDGGFVCAVCRSEAPAEAVQAICGCGIRGENGAGGFRCTPGPESVGAARTVIAFDGAARHPVAPAQVHIAVPVFAEELRVLDQDREALAYRISRAEAMRRRAFALPAAPRAPKPAPARRTRGEDVAVRLPPELLDVLDSWREAMTRPAALRRLVEPVLEEMAADDGDGVPEVVRLVLPSKVAGALGPPTGGRNAQLLAIIRDALAGRRRMPARDPDLASRRAPECAAGAPAETDAAATRSHEGGPARADADLVELLPAEHVGPLAASVRRFTVRS